MTLVASLPNENVNQPEALSSHEDSSSEEDNVSETTTEENITTILPRSQPYDFAATLVQSLGHPDVEVVPTVGRISVENSSDVHFGDKNIYQGPVTIKQIVYANGSASIETSSDKAKDNSEFSGEIFKASERKDHFKDPSVTVELQEAQNQGLGLRKGFIWLQNVSRHRPMEIGIFMGVVVLFVMVLTIVLLLRQSPTGKQLETSNRNSNSEPDVIKPIGYDPDITATGQEKSKLRMISRYEWVAQPPVGETTPLVTPVPYVIIHHTATENCSSQSQCVFHVRQIQTFHIESRGWYDIGYNFLVGGDGAAYEGRGWVVEGAHTLGWNAKSIGIAFVGTFIKKPPPEIQLLACKKLINQGVELGYIKKDYKLLAARQLFGTESPGAAVLEEIKKWPQWVKEP